MFMICANFQERLASWAALVVFVFGPHLKARAWPSFALHRKLSRTNNWNIGKIKQLELENQNLIPLMTNTRLHAKWKFISFARLNARERKTGKRRWWGWCRRCVRNVDRNIFNLKFRLEKVFWLAFKAWKNFWGLEDFWGLEKLWKLAEVWKAWKLRDLLGFERLLRLDEIFEAWKGFWDLKRQDGLETFVVKPIFKVWKT